MDKLNSKADLMDAMDILSNPDATIRAHFTTWENHGKRVPKTVVLNLPPDILDAIEAYLAKSHV